VNEWCIVNYDDMLYFGQVTNEDREKLEVKVSVLVQLTVGENKFKFPARKDNVWYHQDQVVKVGSPPIALSNGMFQLQNGDWQSMREAS
jgi:hypothetical protein